MNTNEVILGYEDGTIHVYNKFSGKLKYTFTEHKKKIIKIILTNNNILTISSDYTAKLIINRFSYKSSPDENSLISE